MLILVLDVGHGHMWLGYDFIKPKFGWLSESIAFLKFKVKLKKIFSRVLTGLEISENLLWKTWEMLKIVYVFN